jgi:pimeloyl-ACP methyl ester carboxylesterase
MDDDARTGTAAARRTSFRHARRPLRPALLTLLLAVAVALGLLGATTASGSASASSDARPKPTIVLVHGAFADASGWNDVIARLQREGYPVLAPANPLRGVEPDSAYLAGVLRTLTGPVILVGHSYGGVVITNAAAGNPNVKALVYVAAFAPDQGETVGGLQNQFPGSKLGLDALDLRPITGIDGNPSYDGYVKAAVFRDIFAGDLSRRTTAVMAATQRPADVHTLGQPSGVPAWKTVPSGYLVAKADNLIPPAVQRFMAQRAGARTVEVNSSHVAMMSNPGPTTDLIVRMARSAR